jgi:mRNA-degrading endonuclease RelE of RelBE toxin-antitoxin system
MPRDLDVVPIVGHPPWLRLRVGDFRVLFRPERATSTFLVVRVINRRDLERAVEGLG